MNISVGWEIWKWISVSTSGTFKYALGAYEDVACISGMRKCGKGCVCCAVNDKSHRFLIKFMVV